MGGGDKKKVFLVGDSFSQDLTNAIYESGLLKICLYRLGLLESRCGNLFIPSFEKENILKNATEEGV